MNFNKKIIIAFLGLAFIFGLSVSADAQRRRTPARRTATKPAPAKPPVNTFELKEGANKVSIQIKNVTKFIYVLGGVARGIEDIDKDAKTKKYSQAALGQNETNKKNVITSIRNLRAGLAALEVEFRTKPSLKTYLLQVQGITDLSGQAEDLALAGQFIESGKPLLTVVEKLSDALAAMP